MQNHIDDTLTVTFSVSRFTPREKTEDRPQRGSSPFGSHRASTRRRPRGKRWNQQYTLHVQPDTTVLDCLLEIKRTLDPTLAFRYSCGHGICGSDAVSIDGSAKLLCTTTVAQCLNTPRAGSTAFRRTDAATVPDDGAERSTANTTAQPPSQAPDTPSSGTIEVAPLPGFPVQRDLIVEIDQMMNQIRTIQPYLQAAGQLKTTDRGDVDMFEYLQKPEELKRYEQLANCISCGICEGSCPVYSGGEAFVGPAALVTASRFINDSRDGARHERLAAIDTTDGIQACQSVRACSRPCPQGIDVGEEMWRLVAQVNAEQTVRQQ